MRYKSLLEVQELEDIATRMLDGEISSEEAVIKCDKLEQGSYYVTRDYSVVEEEDGVLNVLNADNNSESRLEFYIVDGKDVFEKYLHIDRVVSSVAGQNHFRKMLDYLKDLSVREKIDYISLEVDEVSSAYDLYLRCGFFEVGCSDNISGNDDRIYLRKDI